VTLSSWLNSRHSRVAIAGLGGVGGIHLATLARLGIGSFHIADPDRFEPANFNRQHGATSRARHRTQSGTRAPLTAEGRAQFSAAVERYQAEGWEKRGGKPADPGHWDESAVDRVALRRALVGHDLLLFTRRSIPARIERPKVAMKG
jgi:ThiF family